MAHIESARAIERRWRAPLLSHLQSGIGSGSCIGDSGADRAFGAISLKPGQRSWRARLSQRTCRTQSSCVAPQFLRCAHPASSGKNLKFTGPLTASPEFAQQATGCIVEANGQILRLRKGNESIAADYQKAGTNEHVVDAIYSQFARDGNRRLSISSLRTAECNYNEKDSHHSRSAVPGQHYAFGS